jgi:predicted amidophosphoribosyltransferase
METIFSNSETLKAVYSYVPTRYRATDAEWRTRRFVWAFKDGHTEAQRYAVDVIVRTLKSQFTDLNGVAFVCIPASSRDKNIRRYKNFSKCVCELTGMIDAFSYVKVEGERLAIHEYKSHKKVFNTSVVTLSAKFFAGKNVVIFDDIITKGNSYQAFSHHLDSIGAHVKGGVFLAKTINKEGEA